MRKRGAAKTSARSARARRRKSTSAPSSTSSAVRRILAGSLDWSNAHAGFDKAVEGLPAEARGRRPAGLAHSPWEVLEHLRIAQEDILDFCRNPKYEDKKWPDQYWPALPAPPNASAWDASVAAFRRDRAAFAKLANDPKVDLAAKIPHGTGQTYLRQVLLILDHNAYHIGELVAIRRALGAWA
jgi:uncharacterized damage-inducible protein DinB